MNRSISNRTRFQLGICLTLLVASQAMAENAVSASCAMDSPIVLRGRGDAKTAYTKHQAALVKWEKAIEALRTPGREQMRRDFDDSEWRQMDLPGFWEAAGLPRFDGMVWFRKTVTIPASWAGKNLVMELAAIDDEDTTWVNGVKVGAHTQPNQSSVLRKYEVAANVVRPGRNVIVVQVLDTGGDGGLHGRPEQMKLKPVGTSDAGAVSLAGPWRYKAETSISPRPSSPGIAGKEQDSDIIYDESEVPHYDLPPLLVTAEGKLVTTAEQWLNVRRPQILSLLSNFVYGRVPASESPITMEFEVKKTDPDFMGGKATRKDVQIRFSNDNGRADMLVLVFVPNKATRPVPAFMKHSFNDTKSRDFEAHPERKGCLRNGWPLGKFFDRGYAFVVVYQQDLVGHNEVEFRNGIHPLYYRDGQSFPKANEWGVLSAMAWGAMRAMDYLETDDAVDQRRVAIMGHSKCGKATLWTAAQDERFAMAISAQSGCAGAALWRRRSGETLEKMVTRFPYWLCRNAWKFVGQEDDLPVDQHMLLACIAPRPVYVHSGVDDTWADGRGEYLSAYYASEVYRLLGKKGLTSEASPPVGEAIIRSDVGYHIRPGGHSIEMYDWERFLDFADYHLKK